MQLITPTKPLLAGLMLLAATQAHAKLTSYTANGTDLVYSSVSDVTWTKDANLLGSMFASQGFDTVVNAIIAASPTISNTPNAYSPSGTYTLTVSDFNGNGETNWFGAMAYVNYLNSIHYGGNNHWRLPTASHSFFDQTDAILAQNGSEQGEEYSELFHSELMGGPYGSSIPDTPTFDNEQTYAYWTGSEAPEHSAGNAWFFGTNTGGQHYFDKNTFISVWAISNGQVTAVPEPKNLAMLLAGLCLIGVSARRSRGLYLGDFS